MAERRLHSNRGVYCCLDRLTRRGECNAKSTTNAVAVLGNNYITGINSSIPGSPCKINNSSPSFKLVKLYSKQIQSSTAIPI